MIKLDRQVNQIRRRNQIKLNQIHLNKKICHIKFKKLMSGYSTK